MAGRRQRNIDKAGQGILSQQPNCKTQRLLHQLCSSLAKAIQPEESKKQNKSRSVLSGSGIVPSSPQPVSITSTGHCTGSEQSTWAATQAEPGALPLCGRQNFQGFYLYPFFHLVLLLPNHCNNISIGLPRDFFLCCRYRIGLLVLKPWLFHWTCLFLILPFYRQDKVLVVRLSCPLVSAAISTF